MPRSNPRAQTLSEPRLRPMRHTSNPYAVRHPIALPHEYLVSPDTTDTDSMSKRIATPAAGPTSPKVSGGFHIPGLGLPKALGAGASTKRASTLRSALRSRSGTGMRVRFQSAPSRRSPSTQGSKDTCPAVVVPTPSHGSSKDAQVRRPVGTLALSPPNSNWDQLLELVTSLRRFYGLDLASLIGVSAD